MIDHEKGENWYFTHRGIDWVRRALGERILTDARERAMRFFEEACELAQACGLDMAVLSTILIRVMNKPRGVPEQEAAGVYFTLLVLCHSRGVNLSHEMLKELVRVDNPEQIERIRLKHEGKVADGVGVPRAIA